jgi:hypothetical protein
MPAPLPLSTVTTPTHLQAQPRTRTPPATTSSRWCVAQHMAGISVLTFVVLHARCAAMSLARLRHPSLDVHAERSYRSRVYLEPLGLYLQLDTGAILGVSVEFTSNKLSIAFAPANSSTATFTTRRLRVQKTAISRPGTNFRLANPVVNTTVLGAFEFPASVNVALLEWDN